MKSWLGAFLLIDLAVFVNLSSLLSYSFCTSMYCIVLLHIIFLVPLSFSLLPLLHELACL